MIYELRSYVFRPGSLAEYLATLGNTPAVLALLRPQMVGFWQAEEGVLNRIVHLWRFEDRHTRATIRGKNALNPAWQDFVSRIIGSVEGQHSRFFRGELNPPLNPGTRDAWFDLVSLRLRPGTSAGRAGTLATQIAAALTGRCEVLARLAEDGFTPTQLALLLRFPSLEQREAAAEDIDLRAILEDNGGSDLVEGIATDLLRPVAFSPLQ